MGNASVAYDGNVRLGTRVARREDLEAISAIVY